MPFVFVSGNLALDFAGTLKWRRDVPEELLTSPDDVARWAVEAGILTEEPAITADEFARLGELREGVYRAVAATLNGEPWAADDVRLLNSHAEGRPPRATLSPVTVVYTGDAESIGWSIARAAIDLLTRAPGLRMLECQRERCTRVFIDHSRTANRRWCGMEECGNRVKAAGYRGRKKHIDRQAH